jgi:putative flippase GtrA
MGKIILYGLIGVAAALIDFSTFYILRLGLWLPLLLANTSGVCSGIAFSFFMNRNFNFKIFDQTKIRFVRFGIIALGGLATSNALVYVMTLFDIRDVIAKVLSIAMIGACQFVMNYLWTFREYRE